jgi:hypothetical protein
LGRSGREAQHDCSAPIAALLGPPKVKSTLSQETFGKAQKGDQVPAAEGTKLLELEAARKAKDVPKKKVKEAAPQRTSRHTRPCTLSRSISHYRGFTKRTLGT